MKKSLIILGVTFIIIGVLFYYQEDLQKFYYSVLRDVTEDKIKVEKNQYYRDYDFDFVQNTDDFEPARNSGTVLALGPKVKADVAVGDRVLFHCFDEIKVLDDDCAVVRDNSLLLKF